MELEILFNNTSNNRCDVRHFGDEMHKSFRRMTSFVQYLRNCDVDLQKGLSVQSLFEYYSYFKKLQKCTRQE